MGKERQEGNDFRSFRHSEPEGRRNLFAGSPVFYALGLLRRFAPRNDKKGADSQ